MPRAASLKDKDLLQLLYHLRLSRAFEERLSILHRQGKVIGGIFSGIGQEAIMVGACYGLRREDFICPLHRDLGAFLVKGVSPQLLMAQVFGRRTGLSRGKDSYLHSGDSRLGIFGSTSMLGSNVPVACGIAYGFKLRGRDHVVVAFFGEGAANVGDVHEAMNFAAVNKLAVVFVCVNNLYAYSTPFEKAFAIPGVAVRAQAYGFPGVDVYGNDLLRVHGAMQDAIARARRGEGPTLVECKTCHLKEQEVQPQANCRSCHGQIGGLHKKDTHAGSACTACHAPHTWLLSKRETCLACHDDKKEHNAPEICGRCHLFTATIKQR